MAGTLLHITLADASLDEARIPEEVTRAVVPLREDFRLGAVLVDLPFFENLVFSGIRILAKQEIRFAVWGDLLHLRSPRTLCCTLLESANGTAERAVALGALTHMAIDALFHKEIEKRVQEARATLARVWTWRQGSKNEAD